MIEKHEIGFHICARHRKMVGYKRNFNSSLWWGSVGFAKICGQNESLSSPWVEVPRWKGFRKKNLAMKGAMWAKVWRKKISL